MFKPMSHGIGKSSELACLVSTDLSPCQIRSAVQEGNIKLAISMANDLSPETLDTNPKLYFHLYLQQFIELIRDNKVSIISLSTLATSVHSPRLMHTL